MAAARVAAAVAMVTTVAGVTPMIAGGVAEVVAALSKKHVIEALPSQTNRNLLLRGGALPLSAPERDILRDFFFAVEKESGFRRSPRSVAEAISPRMGADGS